MSLRGPRREGRDYEQFCVRTQAEVAEELGISRQAVDDCEQSAMRKLRRFRQMRLRQILQALTEP